MHDDTLLQYAKDIILTEANSITDLAQRLDENFIKSCKLIQFCKGKIILIGIGKSWHISNKIAATLASTGSPAFAVHPSEAGHGDLGMIASNDTVIIISYSGETNEILTLIPAIKHLGTPIISLTSSKKSSIAKASDINLDVSVAKEACPHNLAPTSSTVTALAMGDALAISVLTNKGFSVNDFARSHPSGAIGRRLLFIKDIMQTDSNIPLVSGNTKLLEALAVMSKKALGMVIITKSGTLLGIFTDGDLRRILATNNNINNLLIKNLMTTNCKYIHADQPAIKAIHIMDKYAINSLPVVSKNNKVIGAINTHTLMRNKII